MRTGARRAAMLVAALAAAAWGCAYYNGMYNARRAESEARRLERDGRTSEARDRWQRAVTHAESLAARHPRSRWATDALLLSGLARIQVNDYGGATFALQRALQRTITPAQRAEGMVLLGRAWLGLAQPESALAVLDSALAAAPRSRAEALLWRGLALRALGRSDAAMADLAASTDPRAPYERARNWLERHDTTLALGELDRLAGRRPYDEDAWRSALDTLDASGAGESASRLAGRLAERRDLTRGARARVLLDDGRRRAAAHDTATALARYREAAVAAADSVEGRLAGVRILLLAVPAAASDTALDTLRAALERTVALGGAPAVAAEPVARLLAGVHALTEDGPVPDARWFLRSELLRDSVGAVPLAARAFADMARRFPDSPWTPKALVAAVGAGYPAADSLRALLDGRYAASPYRLAALGLVETAGAYAALEDSLTRSLAAVRRRGGRETVPREPGDRGDRPVAAPRVPASRPDTIEVVPSRTPLP